MQDITFTEVELKNYGNQLRNLTDRSISPISEILDFYNGKHWGSASYFSKGGNKYIITNEHVAKGRETNSLTHAFHGNENIFRIRKNFYVLEAPFDVAIAEIEDEIWNSCSHKATCIPFECFSNQHIPEPTEYLYLSGFSGEKSFSSVGHMLNKVTPLLTQEMPVPAGDSRFNPQFHFALRFNPNEVKCTEDIMGLPDPHGMSGTLVWDTKIVHCKKNNLPWCCDYPTVTGIVWAWPSSAVCLIATKIEHMKIAKIIEEIPKSGTPTP